MIAVLSLAARGMPIVLPVRSAQRASARRADALMMETAQSPLVASRTHVEMSTAAKTSVAVHVVSSVMATDALMRVRVLVITIANLENDAKAKSASNLLNVGATLSAVVENVALRDNVFLTGNAESMLSVHRVLAVWISNASRQGAVMAIQIVRRTKFAMTLAGSVSMMLIVVAIEIVQTVRNVSVPSVDRSRAV